MRAGLVLLAATALVGCGARSGLDPVSERGAAPPRDAGALPLPDAGAPLARCRAPRLVGAPVALSDARAAGPGHVVARAAGFDVVAGLIDRSPFTYFATRLEPSSGGPRLGAPVAVGPDGRGVASVAAAGSALALCYGAQDLEGPTRFVRTDRLDYAELRRGTVGDGAGDHCVALAALGRGRWVAAWNERSASPFSYAIAPLDDRGALSGPRTDLDAPVHAVVPLGEGFAYVHGLPDPREVVRVVFLGPAGEQDATLRTTDGVFTRRVAVAPSPFAPAAVELAWLERGGAASAARVHADGRVEGPRSERVDAAIATGPSLAGGLGGLLMARGECEGDVVGPGRLVVTRRDATEETGRLEIARIPCPVAPRIASDGEAAALIWLEDDRVVVAQIGCGA